MSQSLSSDTHIRSAGSLAAYLYGTPPDLFIGPATVYMIRSNGEIAKLATLPTAIRAVAGDGQRTFIGTHHQVYRVEGGQIPSIFFEGRCDIVSLALGPEKGLFYATDCGVGYVDQQGLSYEFVQGVTGEIRVRGSALYLRPKNGSVVLRFSPIATFALIGK